MISCSIYINPKTHNKLVVVPIHLRQAILHDTHSGKSSGHFFGKRLYNSLASKWWWEGMYADGEKFSQLCPECIFAIGTSRRYKPSLLHPIPVQHPFKILGIDIVDSPLTEWSNVLCAYRNTPDPAMGEKPSFLWIVALPLKLHTSLCPRYIYPTDLGDYWEKLMATFYSTWALGAANIQRAQERYEQQYIQVTRCPASEML